MGHSPKPWSVKEYPNGLFEVLDANGSLVAEIAEYSRKDNSLEADYSAERAVAALIAAAPVLLAELKSAERWLSGMHSETDDGQETELRDIHSAAWEAIDKMRAAIALAKGERK